MSGGSRGQRPAAGTALPVLAWRGMAVVRTQRRRAVRTCISEAVSVLQRSLQLHAARSPDCGTSELLPLVLLLLLPSSQRFPSALGKQFPGQ